jgi:hypothetical protein
MADAYHAIDKPRKVIAIPQGAFRAIFSFSFLTVFTSFLLLYFLPQLSFAQSPSSPPPATSLTQDQDRNSLLAQLDAGREEYLSLWNSTAFSSQFDVFIAEGTDGGYGIYREHIPENVFRPGETIVIYAEPVGFGHQSIIDGRTQDGNSSAPTRELYLINMTVDIIIADSSGSPVESLEDLPVASFISHRQNTEFPLVVTLTQTEPFPVGDYIVTYVVHDQVTGQSFEIEKMITIDENATTGAAPLPDIGIDNSLQDLSQQQQLEDQSQALER